MPGFHENIDVSRLEAIKKLSDRKRTHPMTTSPKVATLRSAVGHKFSIAPLYRVAISNTPWYAPHITNVQLAPCQSPPNNMVTIRLRQVLHSPWRLPPIGM